MDPKPFASLSSYSTLANNPIFNIDNLGDTISNSLFGAEDKMSFKQLAINSVFERKNDGYFLVFTHGNPMIVTNHKNSSTQKVLNADQFIQYLMEAIPEFKKAIENKTSITLNIQACNAANKEIYYSDGTTGFTDVPLVKAISKKFDFITVIGYDGYMEVGKDKDGNYKVIGVANSKNDGGLVTYKNGEIVDKKVIQNANTNSKKNTNTNLKKSANVLSKVKNYITSIFKRR